MSAFEEACVNAAPALGTLALRNLADRIAAGWPDDAVLGATPGELVEPVRAVLAEKRSAAIDDREAAGVVRGVAAAHDRLMSSLSVETVWSGPASHAVPVRATAQALIQVVGEATAELLMMTYSARPHPPLHDALEAAIARGVAVSVVVETLQGAGSALAGAEPAAAFAEIAGLSLWHWPVAHRAETGAKMHAKLAVADRRVLLLSSANLTHSGVARNIEAGVLVRGGAAPERAAEHIGELRSRGILQRLAVGSAGSVRR